MRVKSQDLYQFDPITKNQEKTFELWDDGENLVLMGSAGTGKTFVALYLALDEMLQRETSYDKIIVVRSVVAVREVGFLPGKLEEEVRRAVGLWLPYINIVSVDTLTDEADENKVYVKVSYSTTLNSETLESITLDAGYTATTY